MKHERFQITKSREYHHTEPATIHPTLAPTPERQYVRFRAGEFDYTLQTHEGKTMRWTHVVEYNRAPIGTETWTRRAMLLSTDIEEVLVLRDRVLEGDDRVLQAWAHVDQTEKPDEQASVIGWDFVNKRPYVKTLFGHKR